MVQAGPTWHQHVPKHGTSTMLCADPCHPGILQCFLASRFCEHTALTSPWHMLHMTPTSPSMAPTCPQNGGQLSGSLSIHPKLPPKSTHPSIRSRHGRRQRQRQERHQDTAQGRRHGRRTPAHEPRGEPREKPLEAADSFKKHDISMET